MERSYQFRIYPNARQRDLIERTFGCCRAVHNRALAEREAEYGQAGKVSPINSYIKMIPRWKSADMPWLSEADSMALQQAIRDLDRAYRNFFRAPGKVGFPRFKSKRDARQSYRTNNSASGKVVAVPDPRHVKLPKLGRVKARVSRPVEGRILSATVKRVPSGKYYVCLCCAGCPAPEATEPTAGVMGVDAGVHDVAVCSNGERLANPGNLKRAEARLKREQRRLSRKQKGSSNRERQRVKVARAHERVANRRKDLLHKFTTSIVRESQAVAVEDLNVKGMMANRRLAKAVGDASMSEMIRQLGYKCAWHGREFVKVGRFYPSSKTCSACGHVLAELPLSARSWECPVCGAEHDRDLNAARNIAAEGLRILIQNGTAGLAGTAA